MPLYDFKCTKCNVVIEKKKKIEDRYDCEECCPICGGTMNRVFDSTTYFRLEGDGWHDKEYDQYGRRKEKCYD
jgi:putative FmdB family regulatory protein